MKKLSGWAEEKGLGIDSRMRLALERMGLILNKPVNMESCFPISI